jgi:Xaa-Pro aminopeptidase
MNLINFLVKYIKIEKKNNRIKRFIFHEWKYLNKKEREREQVKHDVLNILRNFKEIKTKTEINIQKKISFKEINDIIWDK